MLLVLCLGVGLVNPRFFTWANASAIAEASAVPLIVGMALTLVVLTGSIDLSVEGVMGLVAVVVALLVTNQRNDNDFGWLAIALALILGVAIGTLNGVLHARLRIPSFMATLGVWFSLLGVSYMLYGGNPVPIRDLALRQVAIGRVAGIPVIVHGRPGGAGDLLLHPALDEARAATPTPSAAVKRWPRQPACRSSATRS